MPVLDLNADQKASHPDSALSAADMRKQANRINFNQAEEEFLDGDETVGLGVLGAKGQVRLHSLKPNRMVLDSGSGAERGLELQCSCPHGSLIACLLAASTSRASASLDGQD